MTQTLELSKALIYVDFPIHIEGILFSVDGNPEVLMTEEGLEICPHMVDYLATDRITTMETSDAEELLDVLFTQSNYESLIK